MRGKNAVSTEKLQLSLPETVTSVLEQLVPLGILGKTKTEIAAKLDAKGVKSYTLEIVDKDKDMEGKVVGTCEGGAKKIVYSKTSTPAPEATKP